MVLLHIFQALTSDGIFLGEKALRLADNLSLTLQQKDILAAEGYHATELL